MTEMDVDGRTDAQPLAGITVLDFSQALAGPSATQVLGDYGANVIKIERPGVGDLSRWSTGSPDDLMNPVFASTNRNKRSLVLDLRSETAIQVVYRLVRDADVVVNNFRPGVMARLHLDYETLSGINPGIIFAVSSGFGSTGPYAHKGGQEVLAQGFTGVMTRRPDSTAPLSVYSTCYADFLTGMMLAQGVLLALMSRAKSGRGQVVEASLYDSLLGLQLQEACAWRTRGEEVNWGAMPHTAVLPTSDGAVVFTGAFREKPLRDVCIALGMADLSQRPEYSTLELQQRHRQQLHTELAEQLSSNTTSYWLERFEEHDILSAEVRDLPAALEDPQTSINDMLLDLVDASGAPVRTVATPVHLRGTPAQVTHPVPALGRDTDDVLREAGYSTDEIDALRREGALS